MKITGHRPPRPLPKRPVTGVITCDDGGARAIETLRAKAEHYDELVTAVRNLVDVLVRCDAELMHEGLEQCTDEEWDAALAAGQAVLVKVPA